MAFMSEKFTKATKKKAGRPAVGQAESSKLKILNAFLQICFEEGVAACTLQKVADRSGVAFATVRYHFNIQGHSLSVDALDYGSEVTYAWINRGLAQARLKPDFDPVASYINVMFDWIHAEPIQASYLIYFYYLSTTKIQLPTQNDELIVIAQDRVQALIYEGLGMKKYQFDGDVKHLSQQLHTLVFGGCMISLTTKSADFFHQQKNLCLGMAKQLLKADF